MSVRTFAAKRLLSRRAVLAAIAAVVIVVSALLAAVTAVLGDGLGRAAGEVLREATGTAGGVRAEARLGDEADARIAAFTRVIDRELGADAVVTTRSLQATAVPVEASGADSRLTLLDTPSALPHVTLTGTAPAAEGEAALHAAAADALGLALGDTITIDPDATADDAPRTLRLVATWLPIDAGNPLWFGDPTVGSGVDADGAPVGPLLVDGAVLGSLSTDPVTRFTLTPTPGPVTVAALTTLANGLDGLARALRSDPEAGRGGLIFAGDLATTLRSVAGPLAAAEAVAPIPLSLIAVTGGVTIALLARLLVVSRAGETRLVRVRGASAARLIGIAGLEMLVVAGLAAAVSAGGLALVAALTGSDALDPFTAPVAVALGAVLTQLALTAADVRRPLGESSARRASDRFAALPVLAVVALALAALTGWRIATLGAPLTETADGAPTIDLLAALAPVSALLLVAVITVALLAPLARLIARRAAARPGLRAALAARQLARSAGVLAVPVLLITLATGGVVTAATFDGTWAAANEQAASLRTGGDLRVVLPSAPGSLPAAGELVDGVDLDAMLAADGVRDARVVLTAGVRVQADDVSLVAVPASGAASSAGDESTAPAPDEGAAPAGGLPVTVSPAFAARYNLAVGDTAQLSITGGRLTVAVADIAAVPGASAALAVGVDRDDLVATLAVDDRRVPFTAEVWVDAVDVPAAAAALRDAVPAGSLIERSDGDARLVAPARLTLWIGAAAGLLLALVALAATAATIDRARQGELAGLRALGVPGRVLGRARAGELGLAAGIAAVVGGAGGALVAGAVMPAFVRAAITAPPQPYPLTLALASVPLAALLGAAVLVTILGLAVMARRLAQRTDRARPRGGEAA